MSARSGFELKSEKAKSHTSRKHEKRRNCNKTGSRTDIPVKNKRQKQKMSCRL
ncbi:MAG: hypothetical protein WA959_15160 [Rivularia sp. (in: cyanobacteria)]